MRRPFLYRGENREIRDAYQNGITACVSVSVSCNRAGGGFHRARDRDGEPADLSGSTIRSELRKRNIPEMWSAFAAAQFSISQTGREALRPTGQRLWLADREAGKTDGE